MAIDSLKGAQACEEGTPARLRVYSGVKVTVKQPAAVFSSFHGSEGGKGNITAVSIFQAGGSALQGIRDSYKGAGGTNALAKNACARVKLSKQGITTLTMVTAGVGNMLTRPRAHVSKHGT
jgi:hypothetical protein